jgi:hypothetical protein
VAARRASRIMRQVNLVLVFVWIILIIPTVLFWKNSILWIALMSIYAVVVSHWGAYQASRAETEAENNNGG